jgi:hypothetical protein
MSVGVNDRIRDLAALARRRHRLANLIFLLAGLGFGTALYLARTRFAQYWRGSGLGRWALVVGVAGLIFAVAARIHSRATHLDEERRELEAKQRAEEQERYAQERAKRREVERDED